MNSQPNDLLLLAGKVLALIAKWAVAFGGILVALAIPALIIFQNDISAGLQTEMNDPTLTFPLWEAILALSLVVVAVGLLFVFFDRLLRIISTVKDGDPFVPENANRLNQMGWTMLAVQLLAIPLAGLGLFVAKTLEEQGGTVDVGFDVSGMLLVIVLFILARVFKHGAAMREDLEGTV